MTPKKRSDLNKNCPLTDNECSKSGCMFYHEIFGRCLVDLLTTNVYALTAEMKKLNNKQN